MKKYSEKKQHHPITKPRFVVPEDHTPYATWTSIAAVALTSLIGYLTYALCSHIPVVDYCSTAVWQCFG